MKKMFCYQCQEANKNVGCEIVGICGKSPELATYMDAFKYVLKGLAVVATEAKKEGMDVSQADYFIMEGLFKLITNANFDETVFIEEIERGITLRENLKLGVTSVFNNDLTTWSASVASEYIAKGLTTGVLSTIDEDIRSIRETILYALMGLAAYHSHAKRLGYESIEVYDFTRRALIALTDDSLTLMDYVSLVDETGKYGVVAMALLDEANTTSYGNPEITKVNIGVQNRPGILISGHDLYDMKMLLEQSKDQGIDIYTHSEMLPAHYYPEFKKYDHLVGNYGNAWWKQRDEFEKFNGPILFTTNCIVPPAESYKHRVFTTGNAGHPDFIHVPMNEDGTKDFTEIIEMAKNSLPPVAIEQGEIIGGFAHNQVFQLADTVVEAVKSGAIKKFIVMAGCDGRHKERNYYEEFAKNLPLDTVILTAGCAKYRYNKLELGDIGGIPRVLDAGQCNDSYSLAVIALKLKEIFELNDINDLPLAYNIAWYEQKAIIVLLALLHLGVKNIHVGPTLPAFLSENVANFLIQTFNLGTISTVEEDLKKMI